MPSGRTGTTSHNTSTVPPQHPLSIPPELDISHNFSPTPQHSMPRSLRYIAFTLSIVALNALSIADGISSFFVSRATTFTTGSPHPSLFGNPAVTAAPTVAAGLHPRILFDAAGWDAIVSRLADQAYFDRTGSWARYHRLLTIGSGPQSQFVRDLWQLENNGSTGAYTNIANPMSMTVMERDTLAPLARRIMASGEGESHQFFLCALWTAVNEKVVSQGRPAFISETPEFRIKASVAWAKVLLAHRAYCANGCDTEHGGDRAHLWDYTSRYNVQTDWYTCGLSLSLVYDVFYDRITNLDERKYIRSALAMIVMKRFSWGNSITSTKGSPNAIIHPHRIFSNWALYHSNLYLTNLAIEGEEGFDNYVAAVLAAESVPSGFNAGLNTRFTAMIEAYMNHSCYPDGSTYEDGYTYTTSFREGSLGLLAAHRRGLNVFDTNRFRNLIHNAVQMSEPWGCGRLIGHGAGGGLSYPSATALFRYVYPDSPLANLLWRQRMGNNFANSGSCRINYFQDFMQQSILGGEHGSVTAAGFPQELETTFSQHLSRSFYTPRRGLLMARASLSSEAVYVHFDCRPDAFLAGHDNADRGGFTYSAYRTTWIDDHYRKASRESRHHSLMHVDGFAQNDKAPSVKMLKTEDDGTVLIAAANLIRAYNEQWAWHDSTTPPTKRVYYYLEDGNRTFDDGVLFPDKVDINPAGLDWPEGDDGADIGFTRPGANLYGDRDLGFAGMWFWKRNYRLSYRAESLARAMRSTILVRSAGEVGYFVVVDSFAVEGDTTDHKFDSYLILGDGVSVDLSASECPQGTSTCRIVLTNGGAAQVDIHVQALGNNLSFRTESWETDKTHWRLIVRSEGRGDEQIWVAFHAHISQPGRFQMVQTASGEMKFTYASTERLFRLDGTSHQVVQTGTVNTTPSPSPSSSQGIAPSLSSTPSASPLPSASTTSQPSSSAHPSSSPSPSATPTRSAPVTSTPTPSPTPASSASGDALNTPMQPQNLEFRLAEYFTEEDFATDKSVFYFPEQGQYQATFRVYSRSSSNGRRIDRFRTCYGYTEGFTSITVLDCGADDVSGINNYNTRSCAAVAVSDADDTCSTWKLDMRVSLTPERPYYLILSVDKNALLPADVKILHGRVRA